MERRVAWKTEVLEEIWSINEWEKSIVSQESYGFGSKRSYLALLDDAWFDHLRILY